MNCPKCQGLMKQTGFEGIVVEQCSSCLGIWFDEFELERLKALPGSEVIDSGDADLGAKYNPVDRIFCPHDHTPLTRMVDVRQPHIWYESCAVCHGAFLDAGEFTDYKHETIGDLFRRIGLKARD
ncbi:MAG: zf-TFIIB domain-containing protein [Anaerolineae bacterium]|nr:zf-TFIIB domain-containing protein [Anaerolineae bacterium]